jgi:hypothetical protein
LVPGKARGAQVLWRWSHGLSVQRQCHVRSKHFVQHQAAVHRHQLIFAENPVSTLRLQWQTSTPSDLDSKTPENIRNLSMAWFPDTETHTLVVVAPQRTDLVLASDVPHLGLTWHWTWQLRLHSNRPNWFVSYIFLRHSQHCTCLAMSCCLICLGTVKLRFLYLSKQERKTESWVAEQLPEVLVPMFYHVGFHGKEMSSILRVSFNRFQMQLRMCQLLNGQRSSSMTSAFAFHTLFQKNNNGPLMVNAGLRNLAS